MAITTTSVFDIVALFPQPGGSTSSIGVYNGSARVGVIEPSQFNYSHDTTSDEFQIVLAAIRNGTAIEEYRFWDGSSYNDSTLPSWLNWAKEQNPFHTTQLQISTTPVTHNRIRFKNFPAPVDNSPVVYPNPNTEYPTEEALNIGLLQDGWYKELALAEAAGDPATTIVVDMETTETTTPIVANDQITGYNFQVVVNSIASDDMRWSDDGGETWVPDRPANPTHYAKILPDGSWIEHQLGDAPVAVAASGALHVDKGGVWTSYQTHVIRGWDISDVPEDETHRYELRVTILENWTTRQVIVDQNVAFSPKNVPLVSPYDYSSGTSNYEVWYAEISKLDGHLRQGLSRTSGVHDSAVYNRITFGKVSYPEFAVRINDANVSGRQYLPISSATGLDTGDTIFLTAADGTKEQCRFIGITVHTWDQGDGTYADVIEVERGINGTTMMTTAQEDTATGTGIIDQTGVTRFINFRSADGNEYPAVIRLIVVKN